MAEKGINFDFQLKITLWVLLVNTCPFAGVDLMCTNF